MPTPSKPTEKGFETQIEEHLLSHGYVSGNPTDFNRDFAMDTRLLFEFLEDTQPVKMQKLKEIYKEQYQFKIVRRLHQELNNRGMIDVLRHGIKDYGVYLDLAFFKPATSMNVEMLELYQKNRVSVTRQVHYSNVNENSVDMLLSVNGLPVVILELKNQFTDQNVNNAMRQFQKDRDPKEMFFQFKKRAVVFFAVDTDEVYMTTRLAGDSTYFLPFNKGYNGGKGNPPNPNGFKTAYLWEDILERDSLLDILKRFVYLEKEEKKDENGKQYISETLIFPRYHQLASVRELEAASRSEGAGSSYLIQHSAGSGKTNSISWLAHRLSSLHDESDKPVFDTVIVITDRLVLDRQLQDSIYQLEHKHGVVEKIDKDSDQLASALAGGTRIIISTLQKFSFILEKVGQLGDRKYAVIIDEAHSSAAGKHAASLREVLSVGSLEEAAKADEEAEAKAYDPDEEILDSITRQGRQDNISYFAFTATPKARTLEMFGTPGDDGKPRPFHLYSMRQAIEEGFILDVLKHYVTYSVYYKLAKRIKDDPKFEKGKAAKALARFVSLHPHNIAQKTEIMIEHFRQVTRHKVGGRAKAMVVTSSRLHAVRYKLAFDEYIKRKGYLDMKTLVAFTGTVDDEGVSYTETDFNQFKEAEVPAKFATDEYQVLLVAEKYQTGFDQPLLHTMFVDKKLSGVKAVQTLSRLNRIHKGKKDTFILDFVNKAEDIQEAFRPYYEQTVVEEVTDPNTLYDLQHELDKFGVYIDEELSKFTEAYFDQANKKRDGILNYYIDNAVKRFWRLDDEFQDDFNHLGKKFVRLYSFLLQITPFKDVDLHKLYLFLDLLLRKTKRGAGGQSLNLADEVELQYYTSKKTFEGDLSIKEGDGTEIPGGIPGGSGKKEDEEEELSAIIDRLNQRFGTNFTKADMISTDQLIEDFAEDEELTQKAQNNSIDDFRFAFENAFLNKVVERMEQNEAFFTRILDDEDFKNALADYMLVRTYKRLRQSAG